MLAGEAYVSKGIDSHIFLILFLWANHMDRTIHHLLLSAHFYLSKGPRRALPSQFPGGCRRTFAMLAYRCLFLLNTEPFQGLL